jgi:type II secretory pathway predicted ATPase ExeA
MSRLKQAGRFLRRLASVANPVRRVHAVAVRTETQLAELHATVEASSAAQLEALSFLLRSMDEINRRLEKLERIGDHTEG